MQTKKQSLIEAVTNTAVGFTISLGATFVIFPIVGIESTGAKNVIITLFFTVVSILRSYLLRRFFNNLRPKKTKILSDNELEQLGFKLLPKVINEEDTRLSYRVAEIKNNVSFIDVINEYKNNVFVKQYLNYELNDDGVELIDLANLKRLIAVVV